MAQIQKIIYTLTDEAPFLASQSLIPIIKAFTNQAGISIETKDISLAARILTLFPTYLKENQQQEDALAQLAALAQTPETNIIKLPNISASVPQLYAAIKELQSKGYAVPDYPEDPKSQVEKTIKSTYDKIKGSAVNPVLREGNSDRRAPLAVKNYAKKHPHYMGAWSPDSKTHVATMQKGDFFHTEKSMTLAHPDNLKIILEKEDGNILILKDSIPVLQGEVIDTSKMEKQALIEFLSEQITDTKEKGLLFSLHMKATMMKVSDPIIFGHTVKVYFAELFKKHKETFETLGVDVNHGFGDVLSKLQNLSPQLIQTIEADIREAYKKGPDLSMVNSEKGVSNLRIPSDVIIDASMPAMIRNSGKLWDKDGNTKDTKAVIPDSSYAPLYEATIDFCKKHGAFDPTTMGTVPNVGLMAQKAEEYGSHDKTFEISTDGIVKVLNEKGATLSEHTVKKGDIWRMCQVKDAPIKDWVQLAVSRAKATSWPAVFWLDKNRAHDAQLIIKVNKYLTEIDTKGLDIKILSVKDATLYTLDRVKKGLNTISVTGNVLRDYLTDLFPILEVGTSAKMLSIVPLMKGGGLFETGAGGSAPKHVEQFIEENHLRWDSLGEFLAIAVSLEHLGHFYNNTQALILSKTLDKATEALLENGKSPSRKVNELDNRGSHFYLAMYWAQELSEQSEDMALKKTFTPITKALKEHEKEIVAQLNNVQGKPIDINGYYFPDLDKVKKQMRPSELFNDIIHQLYT